jgi:hypothetical protein
MKKSDLLKLASLGGLVQETGQDGVVNDYYSIPTEDNDYYCPIESWNPERFAVQAFRLVPALGQTFSMDWRETDKTWYVMIQTNWGIFEAHCNSPACAVTNAVLRALKKRPKIKNTPA